MAKSFHQRMGLLSQNASQERTRSWSLQCEPTTAGLGGKDKYFCYPAVDGLFYGKVWERKI